MTPAEYKAARKARNLTQTALAALLGAPQESISKRETGKQRITKEAALALQSIKPQPCKRTGGRTR